MTPDLHATNFHRELGFVKSPKRLRELAQETWLTEKIHTGYVLQRHLETPAEGGVNQTYNEMLPGFRGLKLVALVQAEIDRRKQIAGEGNNIKPVVIVDVGYGSGFALLDMKKKWGDDVFVVGYGSSEIAKRGIDGVNLNKEEVPTYDSLIKSGVELIEGNVIDIREKLREEFGEDFKADFLTLCFVLGNVSYPQWELFKKLYRILQLQVDVNHSGGILLVNRFVNLIFEQNSDERIVPHLQNLGYPLEYSDNGDLSIQRTLAFPDLPDSIRTIWLEGDYFSYTLRDVQL